MSLEKSMLDMRLEKSMLDMSLVKAKNALTICCSWMT